MCLCEPTRTCLYHLAFGRNHRSTPATHHQHHRDQEQAIPADPELDWRPQVKHYSRLLSVGWQIDQLASLKFLQWLYSHGRIS